MRSWPFKINLNSDNGPDVRLAVAVPRSVGILAEPPVPNLTNGQPMSAGEMNALEVAMAEALDSSTTEVSA